MTTTPLPDLGPDPYDVFGPLVSRGNVQAAILSTLSGVPPEGQAPRIVYYLAAVERANGMVPRTLLVPPGPSSYRGGLDFDTFNSDDFPLLIAVVQPAESPERFGGGEYQQWFDFQVACVVAQETEADACALADSYGIAVAAAILQHGSLDGIAGDTRLTQFPRAEFPSTDRRNIARSVVHFRTSVQPVVVERYGPPSFARDPYVAPGYYPTVQKTSVTIAGLPLT